MGKLNNKGYMLIEIIVAAVLAIGVGYYLIELTFNFSNKNEDEYQAMSMLSDKTVITKNIVNDLEDWTISNVNFLSGSNSVDFTLSDGVNSENRRLKVDKDNKTIEYGKYDSSTNSFDKTSSSYYYKELSNSVIIGDVEVINNDGFITVNIPLSTIYDDTDYGIKLLINSEDSSVVASTDVEPCVVDVTENNNDIANVGTTNYFYGWNWGYTNNLTNSFDSSYCTMWGSFNPMCNSQSQTGVETSDDQCQTEVKYEHSQGLTYIVKFKIEDDISDSLILFGNENSTGLFSGFKIDNSGNLTTNFNGDNISSNTNFVSITKGNWYVVAVIFEYSSAPTYTFYIFDNGVCNDGSCSSTASFIWSFANSSDSTSASDFSANFTEDNTNKNTNVNVTDALFYFNTFDSGKIKEFFGSKLDTAIDISDSSISKPLFYFKNHPTDEIYG